MLYDLKILNIAIEKNDSYTLKIILDTYFIYFIIRYNIFINCRIYDSIFQNYYKIKMYNLAFIFSLSMVE